MASKHPITCHVLNTVTGRPVSGLRCTLSKQIDDTAGPQFSAFATAETNTDGRIVSWNLGVSNYQASPASIDDFNEKARVGEDGYQDSHDTLYCVRFEAIEELFEGDTFFPYIEIVFKIPAGKYGKEHFHIPLLLSKYSYSTYRGS
ncbi:hypothetical protein V1517DRAFT_331608 [Lipomyces orientalis]|uniref:Uncharacterized protein n=1 Tax=Lipomyces orientalis TaxID=1233043 RepID=A0ACC3TFP7_9ASCO